MDCIMQHGATRDTKIFFSMTRVSPSRPTPIKKTNKNKNKNKNQKYFLEKKSIIALEFWGTFGFIRLFLGTSCSDL
jgi:hypothetical protein